MKLCFRPAFALILLQDNEPLQLASFLISEAYPSKKFFGRSDKGFRLSSHLVLHSEPAAGRQVCNRCESP